MEFLELIEAVRQAIPPEYANISQAISAAFPWIVAAVSLLVCFFGFRIHHLWLSVVFCGAGFLLGVITGAFLMMLWPTLSIWVTAALAFLLAVLGFLFSKKLHRLQLFLVNFIMVYAALPGILDRWMPPAAALAVGLAAAVVVGIMASRYKYFVTIITTAIAGATSAVPVIAGFFGCGDAVILLVLEAVLALCGAAVQLLAQRKERAEEKAKAQEKAEAKLEHIKEHKAAEKPPETIS